MTRTRFEEMLDELRDDILRMGDMVEYELKLALEALRDVNTDLAQQVIDFDADLNEMRFFIEEKCVELIATQQPAARDLRSIVAVMNMIVDLERMGDQAKGIAKLIPELEEFPKWARMPELQRMGEIGISMLNQSMEAYAKNNIQLAALVGEQDALVDDLYEQVYGQVMESMAETKKQKKVEASFDLLRAGQELERFADLATNVAERVIYITTGDLHEMVDDEE